MVMGGNQSLAFFSGDISVSRVATDGMSGFPRAFNGSSRNKASYAFGAESRCARHPERYAQASCVLPIVAIHPHTGHSCWRFQSQYACIVMLSRLKIFFGATDCFLIKSQKKPYLREWGLGWISVSVLFLVF